MAQFRKDTHQYLADGKTIFEAIMLADQYGNLVGAANPSGMAVDAFGRARMSQPLTLFDSSHRYADNGQWATSNSTGTTYTFNANAGLMELNLPTTADAEIVRETKKVFSYQPGKSLQVLSTFTMETPKANVRQRVGYFGAQNGIYLEANGTNIAFVERSYSNGSIVETRTAQANWNVDTMLGAVASSPSQKTLDLSKAQILFTDIEWLGLGTVRCGFVIDGSFIHCHSFHHANFITSTYMTTATLPIRYEIKNTGEAASNSTLKQVCSSVMSEGGYDIRGRNRTITTPLNGGAQRRLSDLGTFYPVITMRLKPDRLDGIAVIRNFSVIGIDAANYMYKLVVNPTLTGATWANSTSEATGLLEYQTNSTCTMSGGTELTSGLFTSTNQSTASFTLDPGLFSYQFERNGLTGTPIAITLAVSASTNNSNVVATMDYQEIT